MTKLKNLQAQMRKENQPFTINDNGELIILGMHETETIMAWEDNDGLHYMAKFNTSTMFPKAFSDDDLYKLAYALSYGLCRNCENVTPKSDDVRECKFFPSKNLVVHNGVLIFHMLSTDDGEEKGLVAEFNTFCHHTTTLANILLQQVQMLFMVGNGMQILMLTPEDLGIVPNGNTGNDTLH